MDYEKFNYKEALEGAKKKYNEALERAKKLQETCDNPSVVGLCEYIFPQLRESEDERIRKAMHIYLDWLDGRKDCAPKGEYSIKDMIAWLNKQWSESNDVVKCLINGMKFYYEDNPEATWGTEKFPMKVKDILSWLEKHNQIVVKSPQLGEQEPTETVNWSPQEESNPNKKPHRIISAEAKEAMYDKPWSEEDENHVFSITQTIFGAIKHNVIGHKTGDMQIDWLKSLKERMEGE